MRTSHHNALAALDSLDTAPCKGVMMGGHDRPSDTGRPEPVGSRRASDVPAGRRLDGWKAIAGYFNRDRSTVMRWATERDLPIRRMPGGSVFAFERDLAAWSVDPAAAEAPSQPDDAAAAPIALPVLEQAFPRPRRWLALAVGSGSVVVLAAAAWLAFRAPSPPGPDAMPSSPEVARIFVQARDTWARRTPADIARSIELYREVIRRDPGFAPAYAGLAESWLVYREYGNIDDVRAYSEASTAAEKALTLDSTLPSAHRAMGFIHYWWNNDPKRALTDFQRALALDDRDAQTHFWFANVLADLGLDPQAQREYDRARLILPGSNLIAVEHACSQAMAGRVAQGRAELSALAQKAPGDPTVHGCLSWIAIGAGDIVTTAQEYARMAALRGEPGLTRLSADLTAAVARDAKTAHRVLIEDERREIASGARRLRQTPAFVASAMGDRVELIALLREASALGEKWYTASMTAAIARRWADDREVMALLSRLRQPIPSITI